MYKYCILHKIYINDKLYRRVSLPVFLRNIHVKNTVKCGTKTVRLY